MPSKPRPLTPEHTRWISEQIARRCFAPTKPPSRNWAGRELIVKKLVERLGTNTQWANTAIDATCEELWADCTDAVHVEKKLTIIRTRRMLMKVFHLLTVPRWKRKYEPEIDPQTKQPVMETKTIDGREVSKPKMQLVWEEKQDVVDVALFSRYKELTDQLIELQGIDALARQEAIMRELVEHLEITANQDGKTVSIKGSRSSIATTLKSLPVDRMTAESQAAIGESRKQIESRTVDNNGNGQNPAK